MQASFGELRQVQQFNDGYNIKHVNEKDPSFDHYVNTLNLLDRDAWNNKLNDRNFLIDYPPWININYPQNSSPCTVPDCYKNLRNPNLDQRSADYWDAYTRRFDSCNHQGMPVNCNQGTSWKFQEKVIGNCSPEKDCRNCVDQILPDLVGESRPHVDQIQLQKDYTFSAIVSQPWIYGINRNVDVESKLFGIEYYNNNDVQPYHLRDHPELTEPCTQKELYETYFQDNRHIYPNLTPKIFHNTTKIRNNYPIGPQNINPGPYHNSTRRSDRVDYETYNRFLNDFQQCVMQER